VDVRAAFECVQYLSQFFKRDEDNFTFPEDDGWAEAVYHVKEGRSAATVMGDWANGVLADDLDDSVKSVPFPGTEQLFVYTSDTFPLPIGTEHPREAEALLDTIASPDAQIAFSEKKGSIPALSGIDGSLERWQIEAGIAYDEGPRLLANSGYFQSYYPQGDLQTALVAMTDWDAVGPPPPNDPDERARRLAARRQLVDAALRVFTDAEPLLALWQARLGRGAANPIDP
jgi:ABC-type glycerol-3-phosphate transport system substrate-binding protein